MTDIEGDFWKDKLVHMTHKNMMRMNAQRLYLSDCEKEYELFGKKHPELKTEITNSQSYSTWEAFVTQNIKIRIFVQSQIKVTFLQKQKGDLVKMADAKFPNNPFPEIDEFLANLSYYIEELDKTLKSAGRYSRQQKLAGEFIKANLLKKFSNKGIVWTLETKSDCFRLSVENNEKGRPEKRFYDLHSENFIDELKKINI